MSNPAVLLDKITIGSDLNISICGVSTSVSCDGELLYISESIKFMHGLWSVNGIPEERFQFLHLVVASHKRRGGGGG